MVFEKRATFNNVAALYDNVRPHLVSKNSQLIPVLLHSRIVFSNCY